MEQIAITSNVCGKIAKIMGGNVFDNPLVFVTELMQNSYRARAKAVTIDVVGNTVVFTDDGCGCRTPESILTFDLSSWESTDEGYGVGFWSVLAIPGIRRITITSKKWIADIDVEKIVSSGKPSAVITRTQESFSGFEVSLESDYFQQHYHGLRDECYKVASTQPYTTYFDTARIPHRDLFGEVCGEYTDVFDTRYFTAKLAVSPYGYESPELYYEKRDVREISMIRGVTGVVEMKSKALNLREPDRKTYTYDEKHTRFISRLEACVRDLYRGFIKYATNDEIDRYAGVIAENLTVRDYAKHITGVFASSGCAFERESDRDYDIYQSVTTPNTSSGVAASISPAQHERADYSNVSGIGVVNRDEYDDDDEVSVLDIIKKSKFKVWVKLHELEDYAELKAKAEYYGVDVFVARNVLYENVYMEYNIPYITELDNAVTKNHLFTDIRLKTVKEENFIKLLTPICEHFKIPVDTFLIGNIQLVLETRMNGKLIHKEKVKVGGVEHGGKIILDRKTLGLNRFHLYGSGVGQHELKAILANGKLIAHELAHLLHGTTDNTVDHFKWENDIHDDIVRLYISL